MNWFTKNPLAGITALITAGFIVYLIIDETVGPASKQRSGSYSSSYTSHSSGGSNTMTWVVVILVGIVVVWLWVKFSGSGGGRGRYRMTGPQEVERARREEAHALNEVRTEHHHALAQDRDAEQRRRADLIARAERMHAQENDQWID